MQEQFVTYELALQLKELGFDLDLLGFDAFGLDALLLVDIKKTPKSSSREINVDEYEMECKCPKCGFEYDNK